MLLPGSMAKDNVVDFLDLQLNLSPVVVPVVTRALESFREHHLHIEREPRVVKNRLLINSTDFISLLGYLEDDALGELELKRLLSVAREAIEQCLLRSVSTDRQAHYKWCLGALSALPRGRYL